MADDTTPTPTDTLELARMEATGVACTFPIQVPAFTKPRNRMPYGSRYGANGAGTTDAMAVAV
jgi:hypothetical protein